MKDRRPSSLESLAKAQGCRSRICYEVIVDRILRLQSNTGTVMGIAFLVFGYVARDWEGNLFIICVFFAILWSSLGSLAGTARSAINKLELRVASLEQQLRDRGPT
jgi:hypothetical protein